jgi:hypothetical protein
MALLRQSLVWDKGTGKQIASQAGKQKRGWMDAQTKKRLTESQFCPHIEESDMGTARFQSLQVRLIGCVTSKKAHSLSLFWGWQEVDDACSNAQIETWKVGPCV